MKMMIKKTFIFLCIIIGTSCLPDIQFFSNPDENNSGTDIGDPFGVPLFEQSASIVMRNISDQILLFASSFSNINEGEILDLLISVPITPTEEIFVSITSTDMNFIEIDFLNISISLEGDYTLQFQIQDDEIKERLGYDLTINYEVSSVGLDTIRGFIVLHINDNDASQIIFSSNKINIQDTLPQEITVMTTSTPMDPVDIQFNYNRSAIHIMPETFTFNQDFHFQIITITSLLNNINQNISIDVVVSTMDQDYLGITLPNIEVMIILE